MSWYPLTTVTLFLAVSLLLWLSVMKISRVNTSRSLLGGSSVNDPHRHHHASHIHRRVLASGDPQSGSAAFNVLHYGAKGDGVTDDTKAFALAWAAACKVEASTVVVPSGSVFLVKAISFSGRGCMPNILFQLDGKLIAPKNFKSWKSGILKWIEFTKLKGITVQGQGTIDGQGSVWWPTSKTKPTALRFYGSTNVTVSGITIQNSPQTHLKFDNCSSVEVFNLDIASPGDSPNTDGIHLQDSRDVTIHDTSFACGDDCVSIQTGCSNVYIHDVSCGPGHGISIGGLGAGGTRACVSNVTVRSAFMQNTSHGVRIKTWQGGSGTVRDILFSKIRVWNVQIPLQIDQYYCSKNSCANKTSAVGVAGISYEFITGTYTVKPVHFACSDSVACTGVSLSAVNLAAAQGVRRYSPPFCWNAFGELRTATVPSIDCLKTSSSAVNGSKASNSSYSC
uniref:Polygalacturonase n=1 Tax=Kalanchoe fedtschenkoi TaxID=63787 RepID=A0A7N0U3I5_KALFE